MRDEEERHLENMSGAHGNAKSSARLLCPPERMSEFVGWDTSYVHDCHRPQLGLGDLRRNAQMELTRQCADVKPMYHMRISGDVLGRDLRRRAAARLGEAPLCGDLPDHLVQATTGVTCGGLGLRTALGVALPAFVASRIMCRPLVSTMVDHISAAFGNPSQQIMAAYDTRTDEALTRLVSTLPSANRPSWLLSWTKLWLNVSSCGAAFSRGLRTPCKTSPLPPCGTPAASPPTVATVTRSTLARKRTKIHGITTACVDMGIQNGLLQKYENDGSWSAHARLELGNAEIGHTWMWRLNPHHGSVLELGSEAD